MITFDLLKNHPVYVPLMGKLWFEVLGKKFSPALSYQEIETRFNTHLNEASLPLTILAFKDNQPIGMCSLRENDGIPSQFSPWMGSLCIDPAYQRQGVAKLLIKEIKKQAKELRYQNLYLLTFERSLAGWYQKLGWQEIDTANYEGIPVTVMKITVT